MQRINSANVHADLFGPGKDGFQGGVPATNTPATFLTPEWHNHVQEEIANVIEHFGVSLNDAQFDQFINVLLDNFALKSSLAGEIGKISFVPSTVPNAGHMPVFGTEVSRTGATADLYAYAVAAGTLVDEATFPNRPGCFGYGSGGVGGTTFRVPKINGLIIKAYHNGDGTYTTDTSALIGQYMPDQILSHNHSVTAGDGTNPNQPYFQVSQAAGLTRYTANTGGAENTVRSVILFPQIRYML